MQLKSMKRARDIRDQLVGLMDRVEIEMVSDPGSIGRRLGRGNGLIRMALGVMCVRVLEAWH